MSHMRSIVPTKEPYKRDDILQKRPIILRSLLIIATPYPHMWVRHDWFTFDTYVITYAPLHTYTPTHQPEDIHTYTPLRQHGSTTRILVNRTSPHLQTYIPTSRPTYIHMYTPLQQHSHNIMRATGWQRPIGCLKLQVIFLQTATNS